MNFLQNILKEKRDFIKLRKEKLTQEKLVNKTKSISTRPRFKSILEKTGLHLIAEIKRASPSKGDIRIDLDVIEIANTYEQEGLELVSVLTEEKFFKGSLDDLAKVRKNTNLPILCKDFIIDDYQIYEARLYGADAVLLIAGILSLEQLKEFLDISKVINIDTVVEIHNKADLEKILKLSLDVEIIGINHRDLEDFSIDLKISERLLPHIPKDKVTIAESGIESTQEIRHFRELGVNGILIGESLMRERNMVSKLKEFISATR